MVGNLLLRGMLVGIAAGLIAFVFARTFGEPQIDRAIAFEEMISAAQTPPSDATPVPEEALVSRTTQAGIGLATGLVVYGAAIGGLFSLVFAFAYGRLGNLGARGTSALLALAAFVAIVLIPQIKYPANPPAVGSDETIAARTVLFFAMLVISLAATTAAIMFARRLWNRHGAWNAVLIAGAAFMAFITVVLLAMPPINEMPEGFSPDVVWRFRMSSIGIHVILWSVIGLVFGAIAERRFDNRRPSGLVGRYI